MYSETGENSRNLAVPFKFGGRKSGKLFEGPVESDAAVETNLFGQFIEINRMIAARREDTHGFLHAVFIQETGEILARGSVDGRAKQFRGLLPAFARGYPAKGSCPGRSVLRPLFYEYGLLVQHLSP